MDSARDCRWGDHVPSGTAGSRGRNHGLGAETVPGVHHLKPHEPEGVARILNTAQTPRGLWTQSICSFICQVGMVGSQRKSRPPS